MPKHLKEAMMNNQPVLRYAVKSLAVALLLAQLTSCMSAPTVHVAPALEPVVGSAGIGDTYYDQLGNGGYDVQHYDLVLKVDPTSNTVNGRADIQAIALQRLSTFNLDLQGLTVDTVQINGRSAFFYRQEHELTIKPGAPLANGTVFSVTVSYHGNPQPVANIASKTIPTAGWYHSASGAINVFGEANGAATWFPVNDHPRDKATYRFEILVPQPWIAAGPGILRETRDEGVETRYVWEMDRPMASYLASINIDQYTVETAPGPNGIVIRNYVPPDVSPSLKTDLAKIPAMIEYFNRVFGPYPFGAYCVLIAAQDIPRCQSLVGGAQEVQTLSIHCPDYAMLDESVLAHELAHQWFGDDVSLESWQDAWLKEGMATYAEWLWQTRDEDVDALTQLANKERNSYLHDSRIGQPPVDDIYDWEIYIGGAQVFHALRLQVGDEAFFKILRTYLERYRYGNAGTQAFISLAEEISNQKLSTFFDAWLYETKLPEMPGPRK